MTCTVPAERLAPARSVSTPGPIGTGITKFGPDQKRLHLERRSLDRFGLAGNVAGVAVFLASDDAAYLSGG